MKLRVFLLMLPIAAMLIGCDSNPSAPTAPSNIIVSDSDDQGRPAAGPVEVEE